jgi:hypothetical protein
MAPIGTHCYAPFVRKLPILEVACVVGVILFVALLVAEARANGMAYKDAGLQPVATTSELGYAAVGAGARA